MYQDAKIRWAWLKGMYIYTIVGAGGFGLGMIAIPDRITSMFKWPVSEPIALGIVGSVYLAFALLSVLGLRSPLQFVPILLLQLCYKSIWFVGVIVPLVIAKEFPAYAICTMMIFATYIIGDLIAIPFSYVFAKQSDR
ncbi:MAG TPA: hypothetical protein VMZ31_02635 [Phycisphaerae bacterium]|nr:hypothetical protein [Phycisphaerae bacterium]